MKRISIVFAITLFVSLLLLGITPKQVTAYSTQSPAVIQKPSQESTVKDLGDGFEGKVRLTENALMVLVKMPEKYTNTDDANVFVSGVRIGLLKVLNCDVLVCTDNKPTVTLINNEKEIKLSTLTKNGELKLIFVTDEHDGVIGFAFEAPRKTPDKISSDTIS